MQWGGGGGGGGGGVVLLLFSDTLRRFTHLASWHTDC